MSIQIPFGPVVDIQAVTADEQTAQVTQHGKVTTYQIVSLLDFTNDLYGAVAKHAAVQQYWESLAAEVCSCFDEFEEVGYAKWWAHARKYAKYAMVATAQRETLESLKDQVILMFTEDILADKVRQNALTELAYKGFITESLGTLKVAQVYIDGMTDTDKTTQVDAFRTHLFQYYDAGWSYEKIQRTYLKKREEKAKVVSLTKTLETRSFKMGEYGRLLMPSMGNSGTPTAGQQNPQAQGSFPRPAQPSPGSMESSAAPKPKPWSYSHDDGTSDKQRFDAMPKGRNSSILPPLVYLFLANKHTVQKPPNNTRSIMPRTMSMPAETPREERSNEPRARHAGIEFKPLPLGQKATGKGLNKLYFTLFQPGNFSLHNPTPENDPLGLRMDPRIPKEMWTYYWKLFGHFVEVPGDGNFKRNIFAICPKATNRYLSEDLKFGKLFKDPRCAFCEESTSVWTKFDTAWKSAFLNGKAVNPDRWAVSSDEYKEIVKQNPHLKAVKDEADTFGAKPRYLFEVFDLSKMLGERSIDIGEENGIDYQFYFGPNKVWAGLQALDQAGVKFYDLASPCAIIVTKDCAKTARFAEYSVTNMGPMQMDPPQKVFLEDDQNLKDLSFGRIGEPDNLVYILTYEEQRHWGGFDKRPQAPTGFVPQPAPVYAPAPIPGYVAAPPVPQAPPAAPPFAPQAAPQAAPQGGLPQPPPPAARPRAGLKSW